MARIKPTAICEAWEELVFRIVPWTTEERLRKWYPLYERTWKNGKPIGDLDDANLIITAGWGLYAELGDWENALTLAKFGRTLIEISADPVVDDYLISCEAWAHLHLDQDACMIKDMHDILDCRRPYNKGPMYAVEGLIAERLLTRPFETLIGEEFRAVILRFLELAKRKREALAYRNGKAYGDILKILKIDG